jgi:hypothetical protein
LKEEASSEDSNPFAGDEAMLPREPVAIGATWAVDATPFIRDWTLFEIGRPSKGVAKLTAVRIEKSHRIATIVIDQQFEAVGTGDHQFDAPVKAALHAQYDACIDGTSTEYHSRTEVRFINAVQRTGDGHTIRETLNFKRWEDQHDVND